MRAEPAVLLAAALAVVATEPAAAQERQRGSERGVHFASFDVGIGAVFPRGVSTGLAYGAGFELGSFPVSGTSARLGFRFWSSEDERPDDDVDIDDALLELLVKVDAGGGALSAYAGAGPGLHFVSARLADRPEVEDERDGLKLGLQVLGGAEAGLGRDRFIAVYVEGLGSLVSGLRHGLVQAGVRVRFDRLTTP